MKQYYVFDNWQKATITYPDSYEATLSTVKWFNRCHEGRYKVVDHFVKHPDLK